MTVRSSIKRYMADVDFHLAIAEATHNMVLLHMMRALFSLLRQHIWENLAGYLPKIGYSRENSRAALGADGSDP